MKCVYCGSLIRGRNGRRIEMQYDGLDFDGLDWCACPSCTRAKMKERYNLLKTKGILKRVQVDPEKSVKEEGIEVDWEEFRRLKEHSENNSCKADLLTDTVRTLTEIGILSYEMDGNFAVIASGVFIFIGDGPGRIFFTRQKDAVRFSELEFSRAQYPWGVIRSEVIASASRGIV